MIRVNVASNISRVKLEARAVRSDIETKATVRALNRAGARAMTESNREVRKIFNVKASVVRGQMKLRRAYKGHLAATIRVYGKRIPLIEFSARETARGVTLRVRKGGRKLVPHAFIRTVASGHKGVFVRAANARGAAGDIPFRRGMGSRIAAPGKNDLPIAQLYSISVPAMLLDKGVSGAITKIAAQEFEKEFRRQMAHLTRTV